MLLYANELVYLHTKGRWSFITATSLSQLSGRYLYLPNLLMPEKAMFRVCWSTSSSHTKHDQDDEVLHHLLAAIDSLRYLIYLLWALLIIALPFTLIFAGTNMTFLLVLGLVYGVIVALLVKVFLKRSDFNLSKRSFAKIAFDSLACAPLALNMVRKITLRYSLASDPITFAQTRFDGMMFSHLLTTLNQWIADELEFEDETSPRYRSLSGYKKILTSMVS